ncbi:MAG: hypothetical protein V4671_11345, partial [Armatimonadota bacterium]
QPAKAGFVFSKAGILIHGNKRFEHAAKAKLAGVGALTERPRHAGALAKEVLSVQQFSRHAYRPARKPR